MELAGLEPATSWDTLRTPTPSKGHSHCDASADAQPD